ncbi:MAG: hypothetical protein IJY36_05920, partial [Coprobacter sp.]|nr:hypothetical protein [Coprobacter sp.]
YANQTLFVDYILATNEQKPVNFELTAYEDTEMANVIRTYKFDTDIPVQRNYLTTIMGNVLTTATEFTITIDEAFTNEHIVDLEAGITKAGSVYTIFAAADSETALASVLADINETGVENAVINIEGTQTVKWETGASHGSTPFIPDTNTVTKSVTINGNGTASLVATGAGVGPIRLANGGTLILTDLIVKDESKSYAEDSWEFTYLELGDNLECTGCVFGDEIQLSGNATFTDCTFESNEESVYAVWVNDGSAKFENCTFTGYRGLKMHEDYGSEIASVIVDKCKFDKISKKPGIVIGTLNNATTVSVTNSEFIECQAGDQGLYIYETDTDVTTFGFTESNNTVIAQVVEVATQADLNSAANTANTMVQLAANTTYDFPAGIASGVTIVGSEGSALNLAGKTLTNINNVTIKGVTIKEDTGNYNGIQHSTTINYEDCVIEGVYWVYSTNTTFTNCTFKNTQSAYNAWIYGGGTAKFSGCTFENEYNRALLIYNESALTFDVTVENCTFTAKQTTTNKAAIQLHTEHGISGSLTISNTTAEGYYDQSGTGSVWSEVINGNPEVKSYKFDVTVDGVAVQTAK